MHKMQESCSFVVVRDVTPQPMDVNTGISQSAAISMKTNAQPNGQHQQQEEQRIYTSTPIDEFNEQRKSRQRSAAIEFGNLPKAAKRYICKSVGAVVVGVKGQGPTFDVRLKALVLTFAILIIGYRAIHLTMAYVNEANVQQLNSFMQAQMCAAIDWSMEHQLTSKLKPLLCGLIVAVFFYAIVYLDSAVPGVSPPALFATRSKQRSALQVNYLCAIGAGVMVAVLMYVGF